MISALEAPSTGRGSIYRNRNGVSTKPATSETLLRTSEMITNLLRAMVFSHTN